MQATVQEDDSTTFGELFESLCKSTFRSHNGHSALSKGLKEVRLFGTRDKNPIIAPIEIFHSSRITYMQFM